MTVGELLNFTAFRGADITVNNSDNRDLCISFDDEIMDIESVSNETDIIKVGGIMLFPKHYLKVRCTVKRRAENG